MISTSNSGDYYAFNHHRVGFCPALCFFAGVTPGPISCCCLVRLRLLFFEVLRAVKSKTVHERTPGSIFVEALKFHFSCRWFIVGLNPTRIRYANGKPLPLLAAYAVSQVCLFWKKVWKYQLASHFPPEPMRDSSVILIGNWRSRSSELVTELFSRVPQTVSQMVLKSKCLALDVS